MGINFDLLRQLYCCVETAASSSALTRVVSDIHERVDMERPPLKFAEMANAWSRMAAISARSTTPPSNDDAGRRERTTGGRNDGRKGGNRLVVLQE
jgi:hypothetical protein